MTETDNRDTIYYISMEGIHLFSRRFIRISVLDRMSDIEDNYLFFHTSDILKNYKDISVRDAIYHDRRKWDISYTPVLTAARGDSNE